MVVVTVLALWAVAALTNRQEEANRRLDAVPSYGVESTGRMGIPRAAR